MEDQMIIEMFWARDQDAIKELENKYGKLCIDVANNIVANLADAEEIANETYLSVWNNIPPERPNFLKAYICKIAKNISVARLRYNIADKRKTN